MALVHELRAPLQVLQGHLEALWDDAAHLETASDPARTPRRRLGNMRSMLDALAGAVNDVLELGQGDVAQLPLREALFEVRACLDAEVDAFVGRAESKGLDLTCEIAHDVPVFLWGDAVRLRQMLRTLLDNALKYTACGGVAVRVSWQLAADEIATQASRPAAPQLTIHVTDTGPGIPAGMENAVFAAFARADPSVQGTGLGLWIARQWARRMAGSLCAETSTTGARFRLSVPFRLPEAAAAVTPALETSASAPADVAMRGGPTAVPVAPVAVPVTPVAMREGLQALVVDDHVMNRRILGEQLASLGCQMASAGDLTEALVQWMALDVDVVLTDVQLNGASGLTLARTLHALAPMLGRREPVVYAVTGSVVEARAAQAAGIDEVLTKPVSRERLSHTLAVRWPALDDTYEHRAADETCEPHEPHEPHQSHEPYHAGRPAAGASARPRDESPPRPTPLRDDPYARRMMRDEMAKDLARFRRLMIRRRAEDFDAAQALLHRMRGACRMFGDPALTARCDRLAERLAKCGKGFAGHGDPR
ncbi:hybrid sensor histidine kinase/response regulator [Pandoraea anhela]|nr:ATP-binding protein [Pandoraea anhela]